MKEKIEVVALKMFCTQDAWGLVKAQKGDKLTLHKTLAEQLVKDKFVRKVSKRKVKHG